jgi:hypothetical protein
MKKTCPNSLTDLSHDFSELLSVDANTVPEDRSRPLHRTGWCSSNAVGVRGMLIRISSETPNILTEDFRSFRQSFQGNTWIVRRLYHDRLLLNPFQFIIITADAVQPQY